jgi:hypothetical protein
MTKEYNTMDFCTNCGSKLKAGTAFCGKCGFRISDTYIKKAPTSENKSEITAVNPRNRFAIICSIASIIVTVSAVIAIILATIAPDTMGSSGHIEDCQRIDESTAGQSGSATSDAMSVTTPDSAPGTTSDAVPGAASEATPAATPPPIDIGDLPTDSTLLGMELYGELLTQYREVIIAAYDEGRGTIGWEHLEGLSSTLFTAHDGLGPFHLDTYYYSFYDLDGDGIPELFITRIVGTPSQYSSLGGFGFHTWVDGTIYTPDFHMGGRSGARILRNGVIFIDGSGGAETHHYSFYKLSADGRELELADGMTVDSHGGKDTEYIRYLDKDRHLDRSVLITEEQYNDIIRSYTGELIDQRFVFLETHQFVWHPLSEVP